MKSSQIVRGMDDLGRVVIPKEVRKEMGISEGDLFEIFYDKDSRTVELKHLNEKEIKEFYEEDK